MVPSTTFADRYHLTQRRAATIHFFQTKLNCCNPWIFLFVYQVSCSTASNYKCQYYQSGGNWSKVRLWKVITERDVFMEHSRFPWTLYRNYGFLLHFFNATHKTARTKTICDFIHARHFFNVLPSSSFSSLVNFIIISLFLAKHSSLQCLQFTQ